MTAHLHGLNALHQRRIAGCDTHTHMGRSSKKTSKIDYHALDDSEPTQTGCEIFDSKEMS